jgi:hypothetical protein
VGLHHKLQISDRNNKTTFKQTIVTQILSKLRICDLLQPQNIEMTVFILSRTVESLCHSAAIEHPQFMKDGKFEQEVSDLMLSYPIKKPD